MKNKILVMLMALTVAFSMVACSAEETEVETSTDTEVSTEDVEDETEEEEEIEEVTVITDREGNEFTIPESTDRIVSISATATETLINLGLGEQIVGADTYSMGIEGLGDDVVYFDMMEIDTEALIAIEADIIFATGMSVTDGSVDPYQDVIDAGTIVTYIPSSYSIDAIKEDIEFLGAVTGTSERATEIIDEMTQTIEDIVASVEESELTVYFEISASPYMYSLNDNTFIGEMITILGCTNILGDQEYQWVSVSDEMVIDANPDIIFTTTDYLEDPISEIIERDGWSVITAVINEDVYYIDTNSSNRANENIVIALAEMAEAINNAISE